MKSKKLILLIITVLLANSLLVACGSDSTSGSGGSDQVTLSFGLWDKYQQEVLEEIAKQYEADNPNIKIEFQLTPFGQYWTKLETAATGETLPDIFWMNGPNIVKYASNDMILPIDDLVERDSIDLNLFPEGLINLYTVDDELYGIPKDWDTTALWYNKKLFDEKGLNYPTDEWTWDDLIEAARILNDEEKGIYGLNARASTQEIIYNTIAQAGGYVISDDRTTSGYDSPEAVAGTKIWVDVINEGLSPTLEQQADTSGYEMFKAGKVAMIYAASWNIPVFLESEIVRDDIDLVVMPLIKERAASIHGLSNAISSNTKHPEEAWDFVKYLAGKEANEVWAASGTIIPARMDALNIWKDVHPQLNLQAYIDTLEYSRMHPVSANTPVWNEYEKDYLNLMWSGELSVEEGLSRLAEDMNRALAAEK